MVVFPFGKVFQVNRITTWGWTCGAYLGEVAQHLLRRERSSGDTSEGMVGRNSSDTIALLISNMRNSLWIWFHESLEGGLRYTRYYHISSPPSEGECKHFAYRSSFLYSSKGSPSSVIVNNSHNTIPKLRFIRKTLLVWNGMKWRAVVYPDLYTSLFSS